MIVCLCLSTDQQLVCWLKNKDQIVEEVAREVKLIHRSNKELRQQVVEVKQTGQLHPPHIVHLSLALRLSLSNREALGEQHRIQIQTLHANHKATNRIYNLQLNLVRNHSYRNKIRTHVQ